MTLLKTALEAIELLTTDNTSESALAQAADARIKLMNAMEVKPEAWMVYVAEVQNQYVVDDIDDAQLVDDCTNHGAEVTPLYLHPAPQQAVATGWDNGLSQDYCKELGQWLASRPGARQQVKEMFEAAPQQANQDKARLDWLERNLFHREHLDIFGKVCKDYNMWVIFSPVGVQGSARTIIDAAMAKEKS